MEDQVIGLQADNNSSAEQKKTASATVEQPPTGTKKKARGTVTKEPELVAMQKIVNILMGLDDATRENVLSFVNRKCGKGGAA